MKDLIIIILLAAALLLLGCATPVKGPTFAVVEASIPGTGYRIVGCKAEPDPAQAKPQAAPISQPADAKTPPKAEGGD